MKKSQNTVGLAEQNGFGPAQFAEACERHRKA
jgi:hypothetical protein